MEEQTDDKSLVHLVKFPGFVVGKPNVKNSLLASDSGYHWSYALQQIRKQLFTNTSALIAPPFKFFLDYEKQYHPDKVIPESLYKDVVRSAEFYKFNSEPFAAKDIYMYRQLRSEHVLVRVVHGINSADMNHTFSRLSPGVFLVQKGEPSEPIAFPLQVGFEQSLEIDDGVPIDTFTFDALFNDMMRQVQEAETHTPQEFVPFTYTLGVRYTNPYHDARDIVVRGNIPLWCQTLLITEALRQLPVLPNMTVKGLLPFLKDMPFHFTHITGMKDGHPDPNPELTVIYERFSLELSEPQLTWENQDKHGNRWEERRERILNTIAFCDIPSEQAKYITTVANEWAISQGILLK